MSDTSGVGCAAVLQSVLQSVLQYATDPTRACRSTDPFMETIAACKDAGFGI